jgi:hypothetical protein
LRRRFHIPAVQPLLDRWFPTLVRYAGFALLFYAVIRNPADNPELLPAAVGMILYKTVAGSRET